MVSLYRAMAMENVLRRDRSLHRKRAFTPALEMELLDANDVLPHCNV